MCIIASKKEPNQTIDAAFYAAIVVVLIQVIAMYIFTTSNAHFVSDDLRAFVELQNSDFLSYVSMPIDVHRVPLHRAVNFLIGNLFPMNFSLAMSFLIACYAISLFFLYVLLQIVSPGKFNIWLILIYALNPYFLSAMHWWSAGLHRLPYILFSVIACYGFAQYCKKKEPSFAILATTSAIVATGFYSKGVLIPCYWLAILFCMVDVKRALNHKKEIALAASVMALSVLYSVWYLAVSPSNFVLNTNRFQILLGSLKLFWSAIAQMIIPIKFNLHLAFYSNIAWILLIFTAMFYFRATWKPIAAAFLVISLNVLMIASSSRAAYFGPLIAMIPHYYAELLFLMAIFLSFFISSMAECAPFRQFSINTRRSKLAMATGLLIYAFMSWRAVYATIQPGPSNPLWQSANYVRNLKSDLKNIKTADLNLLDNPIPPYFGFGGLAPKILLLSDYLALSDVHPVFNDGNRPLQRVDSEGHIRDVTASEVIGVGSKHL